MDRQHDDTRPCGTCHSPRHGTGAHEKLVAAFRHAYAPIVVPTFWEQALPAVQVRLVRGSSTFRASGRLTLHRDHDPDSRGVFFVLQLPDGAIGIQDFLGDPPEPSVVELLIR